MAEASFPLNKGGARKAAASFGGSAATRERMNLEEKKKVMFLNFLQPGVDREAAEGGNGPDDSQRRRGGSGDVQR